MMKHFPPVISVLTPVYNGERSLAECIESVRAQTQTDWEYVIVDNCNQDGACDPIDSGVIRSRLERCSVTAINRP